MASRSIRLNCKAGGEKQGADKNLIGERFSFVLTIEIVRDSREAVCLRLLMYYATSNGNFCGKVIAQRCLYGDLLLEVSVVFVV